MKSKYISQSNLFNALLVLLTIMLAISCSKEEGIYTEPSYTRLKLTVSTTGEEQFYQLMVGDKIVLDSLGNKGFNNWIETGDRALRIKKIGEDQYFIDTLLHFEKGKIIEFTMLALDTALDPVLLPDDYLQTSPPQAGHFKLGFINADKSLTKNKVIDLRFFDISTGEFVLAGELKGIPYGQPSDFIELPVSSYYMEIVDHETGEVIIAADTYQGGLIYDFYDGNNVYLLKYDNSNTEPAGGWDYYQVDIIMGTKL